MSQKGKKIPEWCTAAIVQKMYDAVGSAAKERGTRIFSSSRGDIRILYTEAKGSIQVPSESDSKLYKVEIQRQKPKLGTTCNCVAYEIYGPCKHIAAALLALLVECA